MCARLLQFYDVTIYGLPTSSPICCAPMDMQYQNCDLSTAMSPSWADSVPTPGVAFKSVSLN